MNIVFVNSEYPSARGLSHGGIATYTYVMASALAQRGHSVHVLVKPGTFPDTLDSRVRLHEFVHKHPDGFRRTMERIISGPLMWERGMSRGALDAVLAIHRQTPVDIVEIPDYNGLAWAFARPLPFKVVVNFHTPSEFVDRYNQIPLTRRRRAWHRYEAAALKNVDGFRCPSRSLKHEVCLRYGLAEEAVTVIRNPVDIGVFDHISRRDSEGSLTDLLFVGRLERRKGAEVLARSVESILAIDERINLTFAGDTTLVAGVNYREAIERACTPDQRKRVWFLGPVSHDATPLLYCRSSALVFPSIFENAPIVLLEAMAARLPIVASNVGGVNEIVRHEDTGLLFDIDRTEDLVGCIRRIAGDRAFAASCADRAYREVRTAYAPDVIAGQSERFYQTLGVRSALQ